MTFKMTKLKNCSKMEYNKIQIQKNQMYKIMIKMYKIKMKFNKIK